MKTCSSISSYIFFFSPLIKSTKEDPVSSILVESKSSRLEEFQCPVFSSKPSRLDEIVLQCLNILYLGSAKSSWLDKIQGSRLFCLLDHFLSHPLSFITSSGDTFKNQAKIRRLSDYATPPPSKKRERGERERKREREREREREEREKEKER